MNGTGNIGSIPDDCIWRDRMGLVTKELGKFAGSQKLYANLDSVPPGGYSTKYHSHSRQEEFFYVLSGSGVLRLNGRTLSVGAGDFLSKPAGENIAHAFYNSGTEPLLILDVGTNEEEDTCYYPDEDVYRHRANGTVRVERGGVPDENWSSEPNP
jgi:uncharacterized cupin superfamily protein